MATFFYFPSSVSVSSHNRSLTHYHQLLQPRRDQHPLPRHFHIRASANKKPRRSRKLKSDAELCSEIREFVSAVGLPEDHVPSTKELLQHGRNDLANIVRRRGYKLLRELLTSSFNSDIDEFDADKNLDGNLDGSDDCKDLLTGQNLGEDTTSDDITASSKVSLGTNFSILNTDLTPNTNDHTCISRESSTDSSMAEIDPSQLQHEGYCYSTEASIADDGCSSSRKGPDPNFDNQSSIASETSGESSIEENSSQNLEYVDNMMSRMTVDTLSSTIHLTESQSSTSVYSDHATQDWHKLGDTDDGNNDVENEPSSADKENISGGIEIDSSVHSANNSCVNVNSSSNLSLDKKVAKFIQSGDLDPVEDHAFGILNGNDQEDSEEDIESESAMEMAKRFKHAPKENNAVTFYESSSTSKQVDPSATTNHLVWDHWQDEDQTVHLDEDFDAEAIKRQNQSEINNLKVMLYQKELELSQLKEQIEKEKLALYALQTKAEEEINKAQKLISEKDEELDVAEESLSGLKEVRIEFFGDGDNVEVAGSFNGWHHRIKMDPEPSTSVMNSAASRRSRLWSTVLWLYPGAYEIKFIVDGHWRIDPQRDSVTRGHICNNMLRVDR